MASDKKSIHALKAFQFEVSSQRTKTVPGEREDVLNAIVQQHNWQAAWLRAIALAWAKDGYREELLKDAAKFLKTHCDYDLPQSLEIKVLEDKDSQWIPGDPKEFNWRWRLRKAKLTLYLPKKPEDEEECAIALAAYESAGKVYPFTTSF
jgi:ribosomally synthesized peptide (two-chain TOMM family)